MSAPTTTYAPESVTPTRRRGPSPRTRLVVCVVVVVAALGWIAVRGLTGSFVYYLTPTDVVVQHQADVGQRVRLGGLVVTGSVHRPADGSLRFVVTDGHRSMPVVSTGDVPELFRARQGVVLEGALGTDHRFHADTLLVKHDGSYRAPDLDR
ncbi:MAG: cytochrome c maturation protein CcmE [Nocardioidaceae bacterium]|nr:cytochrome c maturation protein CcmE [Nocardioidaceae bacterium]NUS53225.1 cytochrome c maturation protein CcmE [Nocardioidaceae bacterium]